MIANRGKWVGNNAREFGSVRILIVTQSYWPSLGGAEVVLRRLALQWRDQGHQVSVLTTAPKSATARDDDGITVTRLSGPTTRWLGTIYYICKTSREIKQRRDETDIVYVSMLKHAAFAALAPGIRRQTPVIVRLEGGGATGDIAWQRSAPFGAWIRARCEKADSLVAPSRPIELELRGANYPSDRIVRIENGVPIPDSPWERSQTSAHRQVLGLPNQPTLCYTGRLDAKKGLADLLAAGAILARKNGPINLVLVGSGPMRSTLEASQHPGLQVVLPGHVADPTPYLRASDLYILPSYEEGLSLALLEAMALGMPTLASRISANENLAPVSALPLFPTRDPEALARAASERLSGKATDIGLELRTIAQDRFSLSKMADRHLALFSEKLERRKRNSERNR